MRSNNKGSPASMGLVTHKEQVGKAFLQQFKSVGAMATQIARGETCSNTALLSTYPAKTGLGSNAGQHNDRQAANRLSHGTSRIYLKRRQYGGINCVVLDQEGASDLSFRQK